MKGSIIEPYQQYRYQQMHTNNRTSRPSKKDFKQQKWQQKQQQHTFSRKQAEQELKNLEQQRSEYQYQDPIINRLKRAMKWWQRIDKQYFKSVTLEETINKRDICTSNQLMSFGDADVPGLGQYRDEIGVGLAPGFLDKGKIRVLFRMNSPYQVLIGVYGIEAAIVNYHSQSPEYLQQQSIRIKALHPTYTLPKLQDQTQFQFQLQQHQLQQQQQLQQKQIRLDLQDYESNQLICERLQKYEQVQSNSLYLHEIDKEIAMWEWQLQKINQQNYINWNKLIKNVREKEYLCKIPDIGQFDVKIREYRDKLYWGTVLRSFEHGFKDKTMKMLQLYIENQKNHHLKPPKGLQGHPNHNHKKYFETDCKICFSSDNTDSNQVLYCDSCNTSFHLICYGLTSIPQEQTYYCQRCTYIKKEQDLNPGIKLRKPYCQICLKTSFPMKKLQDHFYHVTCLVLFNFVQFRENKMVLKGSLVHQNILKMVIQNQILHDECSQCGKAGGGTELGMQIKCSYEGCQNYCHPICAYLNGYKFELKASAHKSLQVKMFCNDHLGSRVEQVYLRRYMCNLNETSNKSFAQIKQIFENEQQNLQRYKQSLIKNRKKYSNRILIMTRFIRNLLKSRLEKGQEDIETQTQAILRKLKDKKINN